MGDSHPTIVTSNQPSSGGPVLPSGQQYHGNTTTPEDTTASAQPRPDDLLWRGIVIDDGCCCSLLTWPRIQEVQAAKKFLQGRKGKKLHAHCFTHCTCLICYRSSLRYGVRPVTTRASLPVLRRGHRIATANGFIRKSDVLSLSGTGSCPAQRCRSPHTMVRV